MTNTRKEKDALGELEVPADVYWGINTERAIRNFKISEREMPEEFIIALAEVKKACLLANIDSGDIDENLGKAILKAIDEILINNLHLDQFPVDIYQTGSGTQSNMNFNEVIANRANELLGHPLGQKKPVHPNDHVNMGQSSNDVIPTAMHVAALTALTNTLMPAVGNLMKSLDEKIKEFDGIVKVGRTHLQDAVPIPLSMEFNVYRSQVISSFNELQGTRDDLILLPIGGTALGTGLNASKGFSERVIKHLTKIAQFPFEVNPVLAEGIASHRAMVKLSGVLRLLALSCLKIANDIRWMASGPRAGLGELLLPENEPGSSIMPGKINPTQAESLIQVAIQVIGLDSAITLSEGYGSVLDLNVTKPLIISNILESIKILSNGISSFVRKCLVGIKPNLPIIQQHLDRSLMVVTRLSPVVGYDKAGVIARKALESGKTIRETIEDLGLDIDNLDELLDPSKMV
ncbi:MAG: class II fumarate hydratase [Candidatus Thorarchaeota archaeon]|nr:class II fumarate hydratase [Candidatus Thorarchaeota archaeon]